MENRIDRLIMLLSADWFFDSWEFIGLNIADEKKSNVRDMCRDLVKKIVASNNNYWLSSFSPERIESTKTEFFLKLKKLGVDSINLKIVEGIVNNENKDEKNVFFVLQSINEMIIQKKGQFLFPVEFSKETIEVIKNSLNVSPMDILDEDGVNASDTHWDSYIKNITSDLASYIYDYLVVDLLSCNVFILYWGNLIKRLDGKQIKQLADWYMNLVFDFTGIKYEFPIRS